jgi:pimeloyl-ACP methyl ester carboxylesterase
LRSDDAATRPAPEDRVELAYRVQGEGAPVLLVAGTGYAGCTWAPAFVSALAEQHLVITFDHRGTGSSPSSDGPYSTRLFAADALLLLERLGTGPAHVLGHSMGGRVAQWMAIDGPNQVADLVLVSTGAGSPAGGHEWRDCVPVSVALGLGQVGYEQLIRDIQRTSFFTDTFAQQRPDVVQWLGDAFWAGRPELPDYLKHVMARQGHRTRDVLDRITQPTLVTVGTADTRSGGTGSHLDQSRYLADQLPNARLEPIDGAKHGVFWENTDAILAVVGDWLTSRATASA